MCIKSQGKIKLRVICKAVGICDKTAAALRVKFEWDKKVEELHKKIREKVTDGLTTVLGDKIKDAS